MFNKNQVEILLPSIKTFLTEKNSNDTNNNNPFKMRPSTCRCLFGLPDPQEIHRMLEEQDCRDYERLLNRWCFDAKTDTIVLSNRFAKLIDSGSHKRKAKCRNRNSDDEENENIENVYPKDVSDSELNNSNIKLKRLLSSNEQKLARKPLSDMNLNSSVRRNLFPTKEKKAIRQQINKPYQKQLQITDFWRVRKSPTQQQQIKTDKKTSPKSSCSILSAASSCTSTTTNRTSSSPLSRRQLKY